jgi:tetratricopeptide (TPR) repeat protein
MRMAKCQSCNSEKPLSSLFSVNQQLYCETCANQAVGQLKQQKAPLEVSRAIDPSICVKCAADAGTGSFPLAGKLPFCPACREKVYNYDFPAWLKAGLALTLVLLVVALVHGAPYFRAGRQFFRGERLVSAHRYADAAAPLRAALAAAPECPKCRLLLAKADLLSGNPRDAYDVVKDRSFEKSDLSADVKADFQRVDQAIALYNDAGEQYKQKNYDTAIAKLQGAEKLYPEWPELVLAEHGIRVGQAFDRKDYDAFLQLAETDWKAQPTSDSASALSGALACKYAITGQEEYRRSSEEMLARARTLAVTPDEKEVVEEYSDRLRHRLSTREIIDKEEYDRRFRQKAEPPKGK